MSASFLKSGQGRFVGSCRPSNQGWAMANFYLQQFQFPSHEPLLGKTDDEILGFLLSAVGLWSWEQRSAVDSPAENMK